MLTSQMIRGDKSGGGGGGEDVGGVAGGGGSHHHHRSGSGVLGSSTSGMYSSIGRMYIQSDRAPQLLTHVHTYLHTYRQGVIIVVQHGRTTEQRQCRPESSDEGTPGTHATGESVVDGSSNGLF